MFVRPCVRKAKMSKNVPRGEGGKKTRRCLKRARKHEALESDSGRDHRRRDHEDQEPRKTERIKEIGGLKSRRLARFHC
ncbi:hypothetical protein CEXT_651961 [Caerostris extrusa]|uniref:Uncharacterized protein n=1 Tax=Caerostris extrusa TaxID=172846 RepID=A0AAV4WVV3_CAEEX|nr:hypothetical protein CEXT_651961 [Caerostris extrusa]